MCYLFNISFCLFILSNILLRISMFIFMRNISWDFSLPVIENIFASFYWLSICLSVFTLGIYLACSLGYLDLYCTCLINFGKFSYIIFWILLPPHTLFLFSFWNTNDVYVILFDIFPHSGRLCSDISTYTEVCIILTDLSSSLQIICSTMLNLLTRLWKAFFTSVTVPLISSISI